MKYEGFGKEEVKRKGSRKDKVDKFKEKWNSHF